MEINELLKEYAAYDLWANRRFVERLASEPDEVLDRVVPSSFPSLRATILHMRDALNAWRCRLKSEPFSWPASEGKEIGELIHYSRSMHDLVLEMKEADLLRTIEYRDLRGNVHQQPAWQMLMHCFNHSTQHRGQLITIMRMLSIDRIPNSDLVNYQRSIGST